MKSLRPDDYAKLAYIHSNRTITFRLFREKFFPDKSHVRAWQLLKLYASKEKGYLFIEQRSKFEEAVLGLTRKAILELREKQIALVTFVHPVAINWKHVDHHHRVVSLRITLENNPHFDDVFWVSDFEMQCGIGKEAKWAYRLLDQAGREEYSRTWRQKTLDRVPDGYFEALVGGKNIPFVLEYEHARYSREKVFGIIRGLERDFAESNKLFVCETAENAIKLNNLIWTSMDVTKRRTINRKLWLISDFKTVKEKPFEEAFKPIEKPVETKGIPNSS